MRLLRIKRAESTYGQPRSNVHQPTPRKPDPKLAPQCTENSSRCRGVSFLVRRRRAVSDQTEACPFVSGAGAEVAMIFASTNPAKQKPTMFTVNCAAV